MNNQVKNDNDSKKIFTTLILVLTLMICTTSATYAYYAISATATNNITGTAGTGSIIIANTSTATSSTAPSLIAPATSTYNTKPMVPQISYTGTTNVLQKALTGASGKDKCVDGNGNVICRAYSFFIINKGTSAVDVRGSIKFTWGSNSIFNNLRWKLMDSATAVTVSTATAETTVSTTAPTKASTSTVAFDTANVALAPEASKQYWLIVWIEETGSDQGAAATTASRDVGTWYATLSFNAYNESGASIGGVTSTITS